MRGGILGELSHLPERPLRKWAVTDYLPRAPGPVGGPFAHGRAVKTCLAR